MYIIAWILVGVGLLVTANTFRLMINATRARRAFYRQIQQSEQRREQWKQRFATLHTDEERVAAIYELLRD